MRKIFVSIFIIIGLQGSLEAMACSVLYYIDQQTGKIYVVNNEDYWYDVEAYIKIMPGSGKKLARLWYGWNSFAQGGINQSGLFFDGAVTPEQSIPEGFGSPVGNLGDEILSSCSNVEEALLFLEKKKIALNEAHMMFGDASGSAVVVEWLDGKQNIVAIENNRLVMTNFLLSDTTRGNYPCPRYASIEQRLDHLEESGQSIDLRSIGNTLGAAVQVPRSAGNQRVGGTLYSTFINISDMEFVLVYKLDNKKITCLNLKEAFRRGGKRKIKLN